MIFSILLIILLFCLIIKSLVPIVSNKANYCKQNPYNILNSEHKEYGKLLISFYTYYSYRPFLRDTYLFDICFSKRYKPVWIEIYETAIIVYGEDISIIDINKKISLKKLPVLNTESGMLDFYNEYITLPTFYKNYFNEIYVTDIIGKDKYSKLILTPLLANCLKDYLAYDEVVVEDTLNIHVDL